MTACTMNATPLLGRSVNLIVNDPWEFGTQCGEGPFAGQVTDVAADAITMRLCAPLQYQGKKLVAVVARARHAGESTDLLLQSRPLAVNLLFMTYQVSSIAALRPAEDDVAAVGSVNAG